MYFFSPFLQTTSPMQAPDEPERISITFQDGNPVKLQTPETTITDSLDLFLELNRLGGKHGIGRLDIVENR